VNEFMEWAGNQIWGVGVSKIKKVLPLLAVWYEVRVGRIYEVRP
jgi:hypothetical protein